MISKQRSLPRLRLPASEPSNKDHPRSEASTIEGPVSPASAASSRRSVSNMKQLLRLKLQPTPPLPKVGLSLWLDNIVPNLPSPTSFKLESEPTVEPPELSQVPWMSSWQDVQISHDLPPNRYRETPVYSNPGSPMLSRAYFSDERSCHNCPLKESVYDEFCILSDYGDAEATNSNSQASFLECGETFNSDKSELVRASRASFTLSQMSELSIQCQGECVPLNEFTWMKRRSSRRIEGRVPEAAPNCEESKIEQEGYPHDGWLDSDSSRSSSWSPHDEVLDAFATRLAPAKAHVVELSKVSQLFPELALRRKPRRHRRSATPYGSSRRQKTLAHNSLISASNDSVEDKAPKRRQCDTEMSPLPRTFLQFSGTNQSPPSPAIGCTPCGDHQLRYRYDSMDSGSAEMNNSIINSISDIVQEFPQRMLFLDTPCVFEIRRQKHIAHYAIAAQDISIPSFGSPDSSLPLAQQRFSSHRRGITSNLFAPLLCATSINNSSPQYKAAPSYITEPLSEKFTPTLSPPPSPPPPDLSAFRHIFPTTQDWWRDVLYAHLVVYNYVCDVRALFLYPFIDVPPKASRTLGTPYGSSNDPIEALNLNTGLGDLEMRLVSSITWIANCMSGRGSVSVDTESVKYTGKGNEILVRALAEIVKNCERG